MAAKTKDGGLTPQNLETCALENANFGFFDYSNTLVMDPSNSKGLAIWSGGTSQVYRTTNGGERVCDSGPHIGANCTGDAACGSPPAMCVCNAGSWTSITNSPPAISGLTALVIAPSHFPPDPSTMLFGGTSGGGIWATFDANTWNQFPSPGNGLPGRQVTSLTFIPGTVCTGPDCGLFASLSGFGGGHVFRSTNGGANWADISGSGGTSLPDLPVNRVVAHPTNATVLWAATDLGVMQGCTSSDGATCSSTGTTWIWGPFGTGLPAGVLVNDLSIHRDSGMLRAFTFGRSAWEAQALAPANPDLKVNTTNPVTDVAQLSVRVSSMRNGQKSGIVWADDRNGANNWHVYLRTYGYDANSNLTPLEIPDLRVDDTTDHVAQAPSIGMVSNGLVSELGCAWFAWHYDRLDRTNHFNHVFYRYMCGNGDKLFVSDTQVDKQGPGLNAVYPAIGIQPTSGALEFGIAWQQDRPNSSSHDIYARFYCVFGPKAPSCNNSSSDPVKVNTSGLDATNPVVVADAGNYLYIAWEEFDSTAANGKIMIRKYDPNGCSLSNPVQVDNNNIAATERHEVALAATNHCSVTTSRACTVNADCPSGEVCTGNTIVASWWERKSDGTSNEAVFRRRLTSGLGSVDNEVQVDVPPAIPPGAQRAGRGSIATDLSNNFLITWQASVNDPSVNTWNAFARGFDSGAAILKNDFRVDLAPRVAAVRAPRVARSPFTNRYVEAWRDNRAGHYDTYTRLVVSASQ